MRILYFLILFMAMLAQAQPPSPPGSANPSSGGPIVPPGGTPIDDHVRFLLAAALIYGLYKLHFNRSKSPS